MPSCWVPGCLNSRNYLHYKKHVSFHTFPKHSKEQWLRAIGKNIRTPTVYKYVCSEHFSDEDFLHYRQQKRLKDTAVPSRKLLKCKSCNSSCKENIDPHINLLPLPLEAVPSTSTTSENKGLSPLVEQSLVTSLSSTIEEDRSSSSISEDMLLITKNTESKSPSKSSSSGSSRKRKLVGMFHTYTRSPYQDVILKQKKTVHKLRQKIDSMRRTNVRRKVNISNLKTIMTDIKKKFTFSTDALNAVDCCLSGIPQHLMKRLITSNRLHGNRRQLQYPEELKQFALTLQFYNSKAYNYVREVFNLTLPSTSTISRWLCKIDCTPGFTQPSIKALTVFGNEYREKFKKPLLGALLMDEMSIKKELVVERESQYIWGYVDIGGDNININNEKDVVTEVFVLMVVGINANFKVPIGYFFINKLAGDEKANIILEALKQLQHTNCKIVSITFDGPQVNFKMMEVLNCKVYDVNNIKNYFTHPVTAQNVYVIFDVCHMLKLIRNNWSCSEVFLDPEGHRIEWNYIQKLHQIQNTEKLYLANKLRKKHLQWKSCVMKVNVAAQTLSSSVADALHFLCDINYEGFEGALPTIRFIRVIDNLFDLLNSRNPFGKGMKTPLRKENKLYWHKVFTEAVTYLSNLKNLEGQLLHTTRKRVPFIGFIVSARSLLNIYNNEVEDNATLKYVLTYKFSQDHLELFFCSIRSRNGWISNPNAFQFYYSYRRLLVHNQIVSSGNCLSQDQTHILPLPSSAMSIKDSNTISEVHHSRKQQEELTSVQKKISLLLPSELNEYSKNVVTYIAGFVSKSIAGNMKCTECLELLFADVDHVDSDQRFINFKNRGGLSIPSRSVREICYKTEKKIQLIWNISGNILPKKDNFKKLLLKDVPDLMLNDNLFSTINEHNFHYALEDIHHKKL